jgi:superfamily I DNA/RNA helicase
VADQLAVAAYQLHPPRIDNLRGLDRANPTGTAFTALACQATTADAVSLHGEHDIRNVPWETMLAHLFDGEPPTDATWGPLRAEFLRLEQFYNALVFADLILLGGRAATENPEVVADTLFIIDEFQDFNLSEDAFIRAATHESQAVLYAGDDDQVLYQELRRGHPSIIRGYYGDDAFANAMLPFCGRCSAHICAAAESFLAEDRPAEAIEKVFLPLVRHPEAERVTVVASTSPKAGVRYIEGFLKEHEEQIKERHEALAAGSEKDAYLLILTPAREMNYLNVGGAREQLLEAIREYAPEDERLGSDYWKVRDDHFTAIAPTQNYNVRRILSYEGVGQAVVTALLREAIDSGKSLSEIDHDAIRSCLERCGAVRAILEGENEPEEQAQGIAALGIAADAKQLGRDLRSRPVGGEPDPDADPDLDQNEHVGAVDVTTVVGAKGLSADHVIVLGCDDVNMAWVSRNAFFVAITRARKSLTLMACVGGGGASILHPFVCSLPDEHTRAIYAKASAAEEIESIGALQERLEKWAYAKSHRS